MAAEQYTMGTFADEQGAADALHALRATNRPLHRVYCPYPSHLVLNAAGLKHSNVGYFTLIGGMLGFFFGFGLSIYTAGQWSLIVSGQPVTALVPFFIVGFEFTILFSVFGNILGLLTQARLPRFRRSEAYDPRFSGHHFGVLTSCDTVDQDHLDALIRGNGGVAKRVGNLETRESV